MQLSRQDRIAIDDSGYKEGPINAFMNATFDVLPTWYGLVADANVPTGMNERRSFYDYYTEQYNAYEKPH